MPGQGFQAPPTPKNPLAHPTPSDAKEQNVNNPLSPLDRLCAILIGITSRLIGTIGHVPTSATPRTPTTLLCAWLHRLILRLDRLPRRRPRQPPAPHHRPAAPPRPPIATIRAPHRGGWLLALSDDIADHADALHHLLTTTPLPWICAEHPAIARSLRRLCVLLEVPGPPILRPPALRTPTRGAHARLPGSPITRHPPPPPTKPSPPAPPRPHHAAWPAPPLIRACPAG